MADISHLKPGMLGFGPLASDGAKLLVDAGQALLREGVRMGRLNIEHVFVVTEVDPAEGFQIVEAMPSGARSGWHGNERFNPRYAYVRLPEDYPGQAQDAAAIARAMIGTPYSFASYAALALWRTGLKAKRLEAWIDRRKPAIPFEGNRTYRDGGNQPIALPREAICSVLADQAWTLTGKKIMQGVAHQCATPGALALTLLRMEGARWIYPE